jgi:hypothetical protein
LPMLTVSRWEESQPIIRTLTVMTMRKETAKWENDISLS